jgi:hypothetical protein
MRVYSRHAYECLFVFRNEWKDEDDDDQIGKKVGGEEEDDKTSENELKKKKWSDNWVEKKWTWHLL